MLVISLSAVILGRRARGRGGSVESGLARVVTRLFSTVESVGMQFS